MRESIKKSLKKVLKQNFEKFINNADNERKAVLSEIDRVNNRLKSARSKLLEDIIDNKEYFEIKKKCKDQLEKLESKLTKVEEKKEIDFPKPLDRALSNLKNLDKVFADGILR